MGFIFGIDPDTDGDRILANVKSNNSEKRPALRFELDVVPVTVKTYQPETDDFTYQDEDFPALVLTEECIFDPIRLLVQENGNGGKLGRPGDRRAAAAEWLTNYLYGAHTQGLPATADFKAAKPGEGVPAGRVFEDAKLAGMTEKTLRRAKSEMGVVILPVGGGRNAKWHLPDEIVDLLTGGDEPPAQDAPEAAEAPADTPTTPNGVPVTLAAEPRLDPASDQFDAELAQWMAELSAPGGGDQDDAEGDA